MLLTGNRKGIPVEIGFPVRSVDMQRATDNITIRQGDTAVISGSGDIHRTRGEAEPAEWTNSVRSGRCCDRTQSSKSQRC
ncbi:unnamed protein product [Boreogadus saida]